MYCLFRVLFPPRQNILLMFMFMLRHETSDDLTDSTKFCKVQCSCSCKNLSHDLCSFARLCISVPIAISIPISTPVRSSIYHN